MKLNILIPTFNPGRDFIHILTKLRSLFPDTPILVVDDGSSNTVSLEVLGRASQLPFVKILRLPRNVGKPSAIKAGLLHVDSDYVLLLDDDTLPDWGLKEALSLIEDMDSSGFDVAVFEVLTSNRSRIVEEMQFLEYFFVTHVLREVFEGPAGSLGPASLWRTPLLREVMERHDGAFEGDDLQMLLIAILELSVKVKVSKLRVYTEPKNSLLELWKQRAFVWIPGYLHNVVKFLPKIILGRKRVLAPHKVALLMYFSALLLKIIFIAKLIGINTELFYLPAALSLSWATSEGLLSTGRKGIIFLLPLILTSISILLGWGLAGRSLMSWMFSTVAINGTVRGKGLRVKDSILLVLHYAGLMLVPYTLGELIFLSRKLQKFFKV